MKTTITTNLADNLRYLMQRNKITSVELAGIVGVSAELIGKLKNGNLNNPSLKVITGISKHFKVTLHDLIFSDLKQYNQMPLKVISHLPLVDFNNIVGFRDNSYTQTVVVENIPNEACFALRLDYDYGDFAKDSLLLVNTQVAPKNQDYVLLLNNTNKAFQIKKMIIEECPYLQSVILGNNGVIKYDESEHALYGVIVGHQKTVFFK